MTLDDALEKKDLRKLMKEAKKQGKKIVEVEKAGGNRRTADFKF
ncbi:MAG: hypothetical protein U9N32_09695 [Spirochaetota bacterium]|nr:hypothetical protein [Spirochaetota bacterium]